MIDDNENVGAASGSRDPDTGLATREATLDGQPKDDEEQYYQMSQWQLMRVRFFKHKVAVAGGIILILFYIIALVPGFFTPYDPHTRGQDFMYHQPMRIHFRDQDGSFSIRPFVYGYEQTIDQVSYVRTYKPVYDEKHYIRFFTRGEPYSVLGLFEARLRLFGTKEGKLFLFGTDQMGRDLFTRTLYGAQISLSIGLVGIAISLVLGITLGSISGYFGGVADMVIQRSVEILRSFPRLPLWMGLAAALPSDWSPIQLYFGITVVLSIIGWTTVARQVRGKFISLRDEDFVLAARFSNASQGRIIFRHLLPSFASHIIATITLNLPLMILAETSLSFLGIGLRPPVISWGVLLQTAQNIQAVVLYPWLFIPGFFVILAVLCFNFLGDGLRDAADPYAN